MKHIDKALLKQTVKIIKYPKQKFLNLKIMFQKVAFKQTHSLAH